jgi:arginyl-tRNA synthetase
MKSAGEILEETISSAMEQAVGQKGCAAIVRPATDPKFGDYQVNGVMALAKKIKTLPRKLAEEVVKNVDLEDICELPQPALKTEFRGGKTAASLEGPCKSRHR